MADEVVKTIRIVGKPEQLKELADQIKGVADAQGVVARVSDTSSRSLDSIEKAYQRQTMRLDEGARQQQKYTQELAVAQKAYDTGRISSADYADRISLINDKFDKGSPLARGFQRALSGVQGQLIALSAGAGPVGVFLSALGPWGVAAAVGVGLVESAFSRASEMAHQFGERSVELSRFSEATGLTVAQIKALSRAAAEHGVSSDEVVRSIEKFTVAWEELRNGGGTLLDQVRKVDAGLADQMQRARDSASAIDLLAEAIHRADEAGNLSQRNALARAAGGRGGVSGLVGISTAISESGGLSNMADRTSSLFSSEKIEALRKLQTEIDETKKRTQNYYASIASEEILSGALKMAQYQERLAKAAKDFADAHPDWSAWAQFFTEIKAYFGMGPQPGDAPEKPMRIQMPMVPSVPMPRTRPGPQGESLGDLSPGAVASQWRDYVSALGGAATANDRLKAKQSELYAQLKDGKITLDTYNKALAGENFQASNAALNTRIGLLGQMAPASDLVTAAQNRMIEAQKQGARLSGEERAALLSRVLVEKQSADNAILVSNGVATAEGMRSTKLAELNQLLREHKLTQDQVTVSAAAYERQIKDIVDQQKVQQATLPNLQQLANDAGRLDKQLDQVATGSLNQMTTSLADMMDGTKTAGQAFADMSRYVVRALEEMMIKMLIIQPIAEMLQATLKDASGGGFNLLSLFGVGGGSSQPVPVGGSFDYGGMVVPMVGHAGGMASELSGDGRIVHATYYENAPRFHSGRLPWDPSFETPAIIRNDESVLTQGQMAAMGSGNKRPINFIVNSYGAAVEDVQQDDSGNMEMTVRALARDEYASARTNSIQKQKYGQSPQLRQRR